MEQGKIVLIEKYILNKVKDYILSSLVPSRDAQEIAKLLSSYAEQNDTSEHNTK